MCCLVHRLSLASLVVVAGIVHAQSPAADVSLMFRGTPAHTGVANGRLFEGQGGVRWRFVTKSVVRSTPAVTATRVFVGGGDSTLYALDRPNALDLAVGRERWRVKTNGRVRATPSIRDGVAVVGSFDGRVYAIDVATGKTRWVHHTVGDTIDLKREGYDRRAIQSSAAIVDGTGMDSRRTERLIGVPMASMEFDPNAAHPTTAGRRWGLDRWFRGDYPVAASAVTEALAADDLGQTSAWVRTYRQDRPGSGFVQLWALGASADRLPLVRRSRSMGS